VLLGDCVMTAKSQENLKTLIAPVPSK